MSAKKKKPRAVTITLDQWSIEHAMARAVGDRLDDEIKTQLRNAIAAKIDTGAEEAIRRAVEAVLAEGWASPGGVKLSLRERVTAIMNRSDHYSGRGATLIENTIDDAVRNGLVGEARAALSEARATLQARLNTAINERFGALEKR